MNTPDNTFRLTSLQQELWISHESLHEKHPGISCGGKYFLNGYPNSDILLKALKLSLKSQSLLTATLRQDDNGIPFLETGVFTEPDFRIYDLRNKSNPQPALNEILDDFTEQKFEPVGGRLCRFALVYVDNCSLFLSRFFHLVADGMVCLAHFHLLSSIYEKVGTGTEADFGESLSWHNDVEEDLNHIGSPRYQKDIEFYKNYLSDLPEERIFTPKPGRIDKIEEVERLDLQMSLEATERIRSLTKNYGGGITRVLTALHALLIARLYDRDKISIQTPVRYGERKDILNIIGHRVNFIPTIFDFSKIECFKDLTDRIGALMREFPKRVRTPFQHALRKMTREQSDLSYIWDTNINYIPKLPEEKMGDIDVKALCPVTSKYDPVLLGIYIIEGCSEENGLHFDFVYSENHFSEKDIRNYLKRIDKLTIQILENPDRKIEDFDILTDEEKADIAAWEKGTTQEFQIDTITGLFDKIAQIYSFNQAVCGIHGEKTDYRSLKERSDSISVWLNSLGVEPGKVVAVLASRHFRLPELILGIMKAGGVYLPVDPAYPSQRIKYILDDSKAQIIIALDDRVPRELQVNAIQLPDLLPAGIPVKRQKRQNVNEAAYLIYTSGSSGSPKGVLLSHAAFINMVQGQISLFGVNAQDRVLQFASPSFDASLSEIFMALLSGASLYTINRELLDEPWTLREYMIDNGITAVTFPPSYLRLFDCQEFPGLKVLITAGEAPNAEDIRYYATKCHYFNAYGPTETAVCASLTELQADLCGSPVSIGRPLPNTEILILDRKLRRVAPGIPGELCMAGPGLALGYLNRPELTTSKFVENSFEGTKRIYRSGDVAVWLENGHIALMGRNDDQLKIRGHRIETGEIKSVLEEHNAISMAYVCALSRSDKPSELTAFIVLRKDHTVTAENLIEYLSEKIPSYMHPAHFIAIPEMPLTENGKVDKKSLMEIYANRNGISQTTKKSEITDAKIKAVVDCYEAVLGCSITDTDLHKSFFALGGDSLKAIELVKILSSRAGINISLRSFMADSSLETIAALESKNTDDNNSIVTQSRIIPLTRGQQQLWFQSLLSGYEAQYNMPLSLSLSADETRIEELIDSFEKAVECQPVCRLRIAGDMEKAHFRLEDSSGFKVEKLDICNVNDSEELSKKIIDDFVHKKFNLRSLPLIRSIMIRTAECKWQWLIVMHHIIGDAESLTILLKSTMRFIGDKTLDELSALEISKFAEREQNYLQGKESEEDLEFLRKQLTPLPPRLNLTTTSRPSFKSGHGDMAMLPLTDEVSSKLDKLTTTTGKSQLITFTALVGQFLQVLCNEKDIAVAMPVGLRDHADLYRYCGYFVNTVVLRMDNPASRDDNTLIDECNILLDKALAVSRYPFMLLPAALGEKRQPDRAPLVDVLITMIDDSTLSDIVSTGKEINGQIMPVSLRASKLDYSFILHVKQDRSRELILEYDTGLADRSQAEKILNMLLEYMGDSNSEVMRNSSICQGLETGKSNNPETKKEPVYGSYSEITKKKNVSDICCNGESIQLQLADAWQKILGGDKPGSESNFFVLGGDSIKAIQICGILNRQGIHIANPSHFFQYPLFGQFCLAVLENGKNSSRKIRKAMAGPIPKLLPMQRWLFTEHADHWKKFFMLLPLRIKVCVNEDDLHRAFLKLTEQHEALRMSFSQGKACLLHNAPEPYWGRSDLSKNMNIEQCIRDTSSDLFDKVDPEEGKLIAAHFLKGSNESYLLIAGHHLVLDTVSLQIICQDLNCNVKNGDLPESFDTTGIASLLSSNSFSGNELLDENEIRFWKNQFCQGAGKLISFRNEGIDRVADRVSVSRTVSFGGSADGIDQRSRILSSLGKALYASGQRENLLVKMEGHGRSGVFSEDDLSRTVGWFTVTYPFLLKVKENETEIHEWTENYFRNLKHGGATYQLALEKEGTKLAYRASISLNYLGELKDAADDNSIQICSEFLNDLRVPGLLHNDFKPDTPLDLTAFIDTNGDLQLHAWFSSNCVEKRWVDELMQSWKMILDNENKTADKARDSELSHFAAVCMCDKEEIESFCPVNTAQEGMLFQCALDDNAETYTVQMNFRLKGLVNTAILEKAWLIVLQRHENLRSLFPLLSDGNYTRLVLKRCRTTVEVKNLISLPKNLQQQKRTQISGEQIKIKFDLQQGPLITMNLLSYSEQDHEMSWFFHHILMDGWSAGVLLDELFKTYEALDNNNKMPLLASPSVLMNSNNKQYDTSDQTSARQWWKETLSGFKKRTFIAETQMSQELLKTPLKEKVVIPDAANLEALKKFADSNSVSLAHVFQTLWGFILASENNNKNRDVIYGIVSAGRSSKTDNIEKMVGLFMQTLPLRIRWSDSENLTGIVQKVRDQALNRSSYEFLHLADIQKTSELESSLFDNILVYENYPVDTLSVKDRFEICEVTGREWHPYPLSLSIVPGKNFHFRFNYRNALIPDDKIDEIAEKWLKLIQFVASEENLISSHVEQQLSSKPIAEYKQSGITDELLSKFNATGRPYPSDKSIGDILVDQCRKHPQKKAFIASDETTLTYAELERLTSAVAAGLKGIKPGEPVAFAMPRGPEAVIVMAAIARAGGCYLPIDNKNPGSRIKTMLKIADCRTVVTWKDGREWFDPEDLTQFTIFDYDDLVKNDPDDFKRKNINGDMPAYILYTSGSSGEPKGVLVPHKAVLRLVINSDFWDLQTGERCLQAAPLGFDASTLEIWGALLNGGTLSFVSEEQLLSPGGLKQKIIKDRITMMWLTSSLCNIFADEDAEMFKPLRKLFTGGEALSPSHIKKIADACPELELYNGYGPTENTTFTTVHKISDSELDGSPIPIGRSISNTRVYIVNEHLQVVAPGEWGEICAAGDGLALKYIGRDDLTCESFVQLPAPVNERVYRTGDKGRWRNDGVIEFGGRIDGQVKIRGYRIEMSEIENRINLFPGIKGSAVLSIDRDNEIHLVAFIKSEDRSPDKLLEYLRKHLPEYMIPEQFEYIDMLPFTSNGKMDRKALKSILQQKVEGTQETATGNNIEIKVQNIFSDILGKTVVSPDSDFFQLGGHSLKALKLLNRIRAELCKDIDLRTVMENPTPSALAKKIMAESANFIAPEIKVLQTEESEFIPLNSAQERMWFLQKLQPESTVYTIPFAARIKSEIELQDIQKVFSLLENRHEALRLRMPEKMEKAPLLQKLVPTGSLIVAYHDYSNMSDAEAAVSDAIYKEREKPFKFGYDEPLIRLALFKISSNESVLFINIHHIIFDGVSASVILREIQLAFHAVKEKCVPAWKELPLRYSDYLKDIAGHSQTTEEMKQRWVKRMSPLPESLQLPYDMRRPSKQTFKGECFNFSLSPELSDGIVNLSNDMHVTVFTVLLSIAKVFIYRHTSQKDFVIGVPVAGRTEPDLEEMVGLFVNTLPVRCSIEPDIPFYNFVKGVSDKFLDALSDQSLPLEDLINSLELPRNETRNPLFDILVAMEDSSWHIDRNAQYLKMEKYSLPGLHSRMDLSFYFHLDETGINVSIEYRSDLFYHATIEKMAKRFTQLAQSNIKEPGKSLSSLDLLPLSEIQQVIHEFNSTDENLDTEHSIDEMFLKAVSKYPDTVALRDCNGQLLNYCDLDRRIDSLASYLYENGVGKATHVALCLERSFDLISAIFALMRLGAVYVPVPPKIVHSRIRSMIEDCKNLVILTNDQFSSLFSDLNIKVLKTDDNCSTKPFKKAQINPREIAYLIYTSGSTGRPKGVMIRHNSVLNRLLWMQSRFPLTENDVILQKTTISFDVSIWELFWWSWTGASLTLLEPSGEGNPAIIADAIYRNKVTVIHFVPSMLRIFLEYLQDHPEIISKISTLRYVFASGEALGADLVTMFNNTINRECGCELHNLYGPTEATVDVTWYPCIKSEPYVSVPIGKPVANTQIYILDEFKNPLPVGLKGEIHIGGVQVAAGYINQPELTSDKFIDDPFCPGNKLYRTGDLGYWNKNGEVEYSGRMDFQVKLRGYRVELGEIEQALTSLNEISAAVVMVNSINSLEAYVKVSEGANFDKENIRKSLISKLPDYMIPYIYHIVENIPLSVNGKIDRRALAAQNTVPSKTIPSEGQIRLLDSEVMKIWKLVLAENKEILVDQNFFELGGNSLLLIRLHELLEKQWPGVFTPADLFVATTITRQAEQIENRTGGQSVNVSDKEDKAFSRRDNIEKDAVAIIGMALRLSNYDQIDNFWADLLAGADRKTSLSENRRKELRQIAKALSYPGDINKISDAAFLDDISGFDNRRFAMSPSDAELLDPEHRLFLETVNRCVEDAGYGGNCLEGCQVGVFAGAVVNNSYKEAAIRSLPDRAEQIFVLNVPSNLATRISYIKNWCGPAALIDTACSSSLKAIHDACTALKNGECELAVAGGVRVLLTPIKSGKSFAIESSTGQTRTFDHRADGTGAGEGSVVFLLKPLSKALEDGDSIRAVIRGSAVNQDGRSSSIAAPNPVAQSKVIRAAADDANVELDSVDFFEAHGTGTVLGDPIEIDGLTRAFNGKFTTKKYISSVKGNFGHLDAAAGAIGVAKAVCALQHSIIPGQAHFEKPNPKIDFEHAPVQVADKNIYLKDSVHPLRCGVSAFGLSGINAHIILENASVRTMPPDDGSWMILVLSADTASGLHTYAEEIVRSCSINREWPLHAIAATLVKGRDSLKERVVFYANSREEFLKKLLLWCIEPKRELPQFDKSQKLSPCMVAGIQTSQEAERICEALMEGAEPCWPEGRPVYRVNLPPVPLNRITHWAQFSSSETLPTEKFLGEMIISPQNRIFPVHVNKESFWPVSEHKLNGHATMVGMCFPALIGEVSKKIANLTGRNSSSIKIEGLTWVSTLQPEILEEGSVQIALIENDNNFMVSLQGLNRIDGWQEFTRASFAFISQENKKLDLQLIRKEMKPAGKEFAGNDRSESQQVKVSGRWDCRKQVWYSEDRRCILARLELDQKYLDDFNNTDWHPAMLDVAVSLALDKPGLIPVSCREINLHKPHGNQCYSYVKIDDDNDKTDKSLKATCLLLDQDGTIVAEFIDMFFLQAAAPVPRLHKLTWYKSPVETTDGNKSSIEKILLLENASGATALFDDISGMGVNITRIGRPVSETEYRQISDLIHEKKFSTLVYRIPGNGFRVWELAGLMKTVISKGLREKLKILITGKGAVAESRTYSFNDDPIVATVPAMMLSLSKEEPRLVFRYLETSDEVNVSIIMNEIDNLTDSEKSKVYINNNGERFEQKLIPVVKTDKQFAAGKKYCTVISGGLGAMALTLAETMSELGTGGALALLHRGEFPSEEQWENLMNSDDRILSFRVCKLLNLKAKGIKVKIYSCDITDESNLSTCLDRIREELGPVGAVLHTAGVPGDGFLIGKSQEKFENVLAPKITGTNNLHKLTLNDDLVYFILASSRTGLTGAAGQTDYAAANAYLDAFAQWRVAQGLPALSIDWNSWKNIGMAARSSSIDNSMPGLLPEQASDVVKNALLSGETQLVISMTGEDLSGKNLQTKLIPESCINDRSKPGEEKKNMPFQDRIMSIIAEGLGYKNKLSEDDDFYSLGGDSITGMHIVNHINQEEKLNISLADLFSNSRLGGFINAIKQMQNELKDKTEKSPVIPDLDEYPVSWEQLAIVQAETNLNPGTGYNLPHFVKLPDNVNLEKLELAFDKLVKLHEILRTKFDRIHSERPVMRILPPCNIKLQVIKIETLDRNTVEKIVTPFKLDNAPLFRTAILDSSKEGRVLFFDIHHSLADAKSIVILLSQLFSLYNGENIEFTGLQQKDAAWLQQNDKNDDAEAEKYWLEQYKNNIPYLDLPSDFLRPVRHTFRAGSASFIIPPELVAGIRSLVRQNSTTSYNFLLSVWSMLFARYASTDDLVIAVAADGRDNEKLCNTPGMFVSLIPLRMKIDESESFSQLLKINQQLNTEAFRHRSYSLNRLLNKLKVPANPDRTVLSEITFSYMNFENPKSADGDFKALNIPNPSTKADLAIFATDTTELLSFSIEYYSDLFTEKRIQRMSHHFLNLLRQILQKGCDLQLRSFSLIENEEKAMIECFKSGPGMTFIDKSIDSLVWINTAKQGNTVIWRNRDGSVLNWKDLDRRSTKIAAKLKELGVQAGDEIYLDNGNHSDLPLLMLSIARCGAFSVLATENKLNNEARWFITDSEENDCQGNTGVLNRRFLLNQNDTIQKNIQFDVPPEFTAFCIQDSDKTRVNINQLTLHYLAGQFQECGISQGDRILLSEDTFTLIGQLQLWSSLLAGGAIVPVQNDYLSNPFQSLHKISAIEADVLIAESSELTRADKKNAEVLCRFKRLILIGDEVPDYHLLRSWAQLCPELNIVTALRIPGSAFLMSISEFRDESRDFLKAGRPMACNQISIIDNNGMESPIGVWGNLFLNGLVNESVSSVEQLVFEKPWKRTDIVARWGDNGDIELRGLVKDSDCYSALLRSAILEKECVNKVELKRNSGGGWNALVIADSSFDPVQTKRALRKVLPVQLPNFSIEMVENERIPVKAYCEKNILKSETEKRVIQVFRTFFKKENISTDDSFFDLGGHSLLGFQIINQLSGEFKKELSIKDLYENPSPAELAELLEKSNHDALTISNAPVNNTGLYPLSHAQQRLYVQHYSEGGSVAYNFTFAFRIEGNLDNDRLREALGRLCERHEILRTAFMEKDGQLWQFVDCGKEFSADISFHDLNELTMGDALKLFSEDAVKPFSLDKPGLFRVRCCRIEEKINLLALTMHHIIADGWSMQLFFRELMEFYMGDGKTELPPLQIQYRDYSVWQQNRDWNEDTAYWKKELSGARQGVNLPADRINSGSCHNLGVIQKILPDQLMGRIRELAKKKAVSPATLILSVFASFLYRLTRQEDMVIGMGVAGREKKELEGLIGFFVNILPMRIRVNDETDFNDLIDSVHRLSVEAVSRQDYPYDMLIRNISPDRKNAREALINVMFEYQRYGDLSLGGDVQIPNLPFSVSPIYLHEHDDSENVAPAQAKYDLTLFIQDMKPDCLMRAEFDASIFNENSIDSWLTFIEQFLTGITDA